MINFPNIYFYICSCNLPINSIEMLNSYFNLGNQQNKMHACANTGKTRKRNKFERILSCLILTKKGKENSYKYKELQTKSILRFHTIILFSKHPSAWFTTVEVII